MNTIAQDIIELATKKDITLAVAESITGGRIAAALTAVPGSSTVFLCGIVAYHENAKIHSLGVSLDEINATHGYSAKTASQMAHNVRMRNNADLSVATTGCAGPDAVEGFEAGRVLFAISRKREEMQIFDENFTGDREAVQEQATEFALQKLLESISKT